MFILFFSAYSVASDNAKHGLDVLPDVCILCPGRPQLTNSTERSIHFAIFHSSRRAKSRKDEHDLAPFP